MRAPFSLRTHLLRPRFPVATPLIAVRRHPARFVTSCLVLGSVALASACTDGGPEGDRVRWEPWARLTLKCPSIEGTYELAGRRPPLSQTLLGDLAQSSGARFPWETMTIAGDADDSLVVTLARSEAQRAAYRDYVFSRGAYYENEYKRLHRPDVRWSSGFATMTDDEYEENLQKLYLSPTRSHTLKRRDHYTCKSGWVRVERVVSDPGPDRSNPRPDTVIGVVMLRRGWKGSLVARADYRDEQEFMLWCGDGCKGVPLGTWNVHDWGRWPSAPGAANGAVARPWGEPFDAPEVRVSERAPANTPDVIAGALRPMLPAGLQLQSMIRDGDGYRAQLVSRNTTPFTQLVDAVRRSYHFRHERVVGLTRGAGGDWILSLGLGDIWKNSPANPHDPTGALTQALPDGVRMVGVRGAGKGIEVTLVSTEQAPMDDAVSAITRLTAYDSVAVKSSIRSSYDQSIVTIVYVRERAEP